MPSICCCFVGVFAAYCLYCEMVKILHYCWFGGNPLPESAKRYMETWKKFCPDYEIKRWDESNFDVNSVPFVAEAYAAKKWAFVSDYVRTYALYHEGGLYVDTDVEFVKGIDDLTGTSFMGFELPDIVNPGLILYAVTPREAFYEEILKRYESLHFSAEEMRDLTSPKIFTKLLTERGLRLDGTLQHVGDVTVYPMEYFQPMGVKWKEVSATPNTRSIHHYNASWIDAREREYLFYRKHHGEKWGRVLYSFRHPILAWERFVASRRRRKEQKREHGTD